jgi:hypothetical protein
MAREKKPTNSDSESTEEVSELERLGLGPPDATDDPITHREEEELELMEQHESKLGERL